MAFADSSEARAFARQKEERQARQVRAYEGRKQYVETKLEGKTVSELTPDERKLAETYYYQKGFITNEEMRQAKAQEAARVTEVSAATVTPVKATGSMVGLAQPKTEYLSDPMHNAGKFASGTWAGIKEGGLNLLAYPVVLASGLLTKPGETIKQVAIGAAMFLPHQELIDIKSMSQTTPEESGRKFGFELATLSPVIVLSAIASQQPKVSYELGNVNVRETGLNKVEGFTNYESVSYGITKQTHPLKGTEIQRVSVSSEFITSQQGVTVSRGDLYLSLGKGTVDTWAGKEMISKNFITKQFTIDTGTPISLHFGKSISRGEKGVFGLGIAKEIAPNTFDYFGGTITSTQKIPTAYRINVVSPPSEGSVFNLGTGGAGTTLKGTAGIPSIAAAQITKQAAMSVSIVPKSYIPIGMPSLSLNQEIKTAQISMSGLTQTTKQSQSYVQIGAIKQKQYGMQIQYQETAQKPQLKQIISPITIIGQHTRIAQITSPIQISDQTSTQIQEFKMPQQMRQPTPSKSYYPSINTYTPNVMPFSMGFELGGKTRGFSMFGKQKTKYTPSLGALTFNIKAQKMPKFAFSGLVTRPIIRSKRQKRRK